MDIEVELQRRSRFGKRDGAHDYSWLAGVEAVPPSLAPVCEALARVAANAGAFISLVAGDDSSLWLVRAYSSGLDNVYRPTAAVEAAEVVSPRLLPLRDWLGLAFVGIQQSERERIGEAAAFRISVPPPQADLPVPDAALLTRARLGLPLVTTTRGALSLLGEIPWRYRGICYALRGKGAPPADWVPELAPFLCINFTEPTLSDEEDEVLRLALGRDISSVEWGQIDRLGARPLRVALRWAAAGEDRPMPVASAEDPLVTWLIAYRGAFYRGAQLLARLRRDLPLVPLPEAAVEAATRDLPPRAAEFVSRVVRGETPEPTLEVVEELAEGNYLADESVVPLRLWAGLAGRSPLVAAQAIGRFLARGAERADAAFALDLDVTTAASVNADAVAAAAQLARSWGLPAPRQRLLRAVRGATVEAQLHALRELGAIYGGWAEALTRLAAEGVLPPAGLLSPPEMLAALQGRSAALGLRTALWDAVAALRGEGREGEAVALLEAAQAAPVLYVSEATRRVVASRLGLGPPSRPPSPQGLGHLAHADLARPEDILLEAADAPELVFYARVWSKTASLAEVLCDGNEAVAAVPYAPPSWAGALGKALTPRRAESWLARLDAGRRDEGRRWLAELQGLDAGIVGALSGEMISGLEREKVLSNLDWLSALLSSVPEAGRLEGLGTVARGGVAAGDELFASGLVSLLLPSADGHEREFALHALSGVGPMPPPAGLLADFVSALLPALDVAALIDAVFASRDTGLSANPELCRTLAAAAAARSLSCPARGYTSEQRRRHLPLARALSGVPGWEVIAPDAAARAAYVLELMKRLGLRPEDLRSGEPQGVAAEISTGDSLASGGSTTAPASTPKEGYE